MNSKPSYILGLSFFYHDAAAVLLRDGELVVMAEEERFSRKKHDSGFPVHAINFVLKEAGLTAAEVDATVFYEKPFLKLERIFKVNLATWPFAPRVFAESTKHLFLDKIWIRSLISRKLDIDATKIFFSEHHLSHAASAYFASPYDKAAVLTIDGVGEWAVTTLGRGEGNRLETLKEIRFPHSLGLLYSAFTAFLGFEVNEGEYKVMGMAPYGRPVYRDQVKKMIHFFEDGSYELDLSYFSFYRSLERTYSKKFTDLFGKPRDPRSKFFTRATGWPSYFGEKPQGDQFDKIAEAQERYADIAASVQAVLEEAIIHLAQAAHRLTGLDRLAYAGGVALNCVANWKIAQNTPFKQIYIQPAAGDGGGALGAALAFYHQALGGTRRFIMKRADYGAAYSDDEIKKFLDKEGINYQFIGDEDKLCDQVARAIEAGRVIGWFQGRFEWGPRALGSRSILADPRRSDMKDMVNTKIKFREPYRPFAPSVLAERAEDFFDLPGAINHLPARFMLYVANVKKNRRKQVPAITHVDGTARPQLVYPDATPRYYKLINSFSRLTDVPLVMNTSFNLKGEPIVNTPADAYSTFIRSGLDMLVLNNFLITKIQHE